MPFNPKDDFHLFEHLASQIPYSVPSPLVSRYEKLVYEIDKINVITACQLITAIARNNRFCDGALVDFFESGFGFESAEEDEVDGWLICANQYINFRYTSKA